MCSFYFYRNLALTIIAVNVFGSFESQAVQSDTAPNSDSPTPLQSTHSDNHQDKDEHSDEDKHHDEHDDEVESILVLSTRLGRSINDEPIRVEVIVREELEEKAIMRPGNISMLVAETGGVRVQTTSPALGSANIRLQGLYGRYTQLLNDGLPLYGGQASSIGLLQIPPTDLSSVEIIPIRVNK